MQTYRCVSLCTAILNTHPHNIITCSSGMSNSGGQITLLCSFALSRSPPPMLMNLVRSLCSPCKLLGSAGCLGYWRSLHIFVCNIAEEAAVTSCRVYNTLLTKKGLGELVRYLKLQKHHTFYRGTHSPQIERLSGSFVCRGII